MKTDEIQKIFSVDYNPKSFEVTWTEDDKKACLNYAEDEDYSIKDCSILNRKFIASNSSISKNQLKLIKFHDSVMEFVGKKDGVGTV